MNLARRRFWHLAAGELPCWWLSATSRGRTPIHRRACLGACPEAFEDFNDIGRVRSSDRGEHMKRREFITRPRYWQEREVAMAIGYTSASIARSQPGPQVPRR